MKNVLLISLGFLLLVGGCKKEETQTCTCPEPVEPYVSVKSAGDTANGILVVIYNKVEDNYNNAQCAGKYMEVVGSGASGDPDSFVNFYKVINELPDSVMNNTNYGNTEWLVNVKYLGIGIECYVDAFFVDPSPGNEVSINQVELVEITHIEPFL